ncbi:hypothetical protein BGX21_007125, partial [Mortierella sp. AD011]
MSILRLNCFVKGDKDPFTVKIPGEDTISLLKDEIKLKKSAFTNMDASTITVWLAPNAASVDSINDAQTTFTAENGLGNLVLLESLFPNGAIPGAIHIIVKDPLQ